MQMVDFNQYVQNQRMYGGTAGRKMGIVYEGKNYILKFPGNLKEQRMKNIQLSYSNSPVCEYIGSRIYELLGFPVLTEIQKKFYLALIESRYEKVLKPVCQKVIEQQTVEDRQSDTSKERRCR